MYITTRSYLTAGIAALGAGAIALSPVQPVPSHLAIAPHPAVSNLAVELAASSFDPITPWVTTIETSFANIGTLVEFYLDKPFPVLQTVVANLGTYFAELTSGNAGLIPGQIWNNVQTLFQAPFDPGPGAEVPTGPTDTFISTGDNISRTDNGGVNTGSPYNFYLNLLQLLVGETLSKDCAVEDCLLPQAAPVLNFLNTPVSGLLLGLLGPVLSPVAQVINSFTAIGEFVMAGDIVGAINEVINIPANLVNAVLNGAVFDLTPIVNAFQPLTDGSTLGISLGGLLTSTPFNGSVLDPNDAPTQWSGGVGFDALVADVTLPLDGGGFFEAQANGLPLGPVGSLIGMGQLLGDALRVTPPATAPVAATGPEAAKLAAPVDIAAPALTEAPADEAAPVTVDVPDPVQESAVVEEVGAEAEPAAVSTVREVKEPAPVAAPAEDSAPAPAAAQESDDSDDTGRGAHSRRGARTAG